MTLPAATGRQVLVGEKDQKMGYCVSRPRMSEAMVWKAPVIWAAVAVVATIITLTGHVTGPPVTPADDDGSSWVAEPTQKSIDRYFYPQNPAWRLSGVAYYGRHEN